MNERIKFLWVEALESGDYIQAKSALHEDGRYCCLGVLCELYIQEHSDCEWKPSHTPGAMSFMNQTAILPNKVWTWAELDGCNPGVIINDELFPLANHNDCGASFPEIAKVIREQL